MENDPFGNLGEWGPVLDVLERLTVQGELVYCQRGLIRILRYKGNWRLREEVLKRIGALQEPSAGLILQTLEILADDNIYYDARILAGRALLQMLEKKPSSESEAIDTQVRRVGLRLRNIPHPPFFQKALSPFLSKLDLTPSQQN